MARTVAKYVFAALLALLLPQTAGPCFKVAAGVEIANSTGARQQAPREARLAPCLELQASQPAAPSYRSQTRPEPEIAALFQRPPPGPSLVV